MVKLYSKMKIIRHTKDGVEEVIPKRTVFDGTPAEAKQFVSELQAGGSTDINRALLEALAQVDKKRPTVIVFMTDGLPTVGEVDAQRIIDNVRKLGRPVQANWAPFPVMSSLGSALGLVSQQYRLSGVSLEIEVDAGEEVTVMGDPTLFEIAVLNILLNALEAFGHQRHSGVGAPSVLVRAS